ncbi:hypothetical protein TSOC_010794 [Tetrabaena socialis]|uniref:Uncharacterized protein n=1 Tax=Tetrabaena socialis TaxID=47790 RepID=A0A2J7ZSC0_9CHLO|nr:hypothetical protein TSOC_010794 [Tetrabaena socialis]|eukprot:PNH03166.1 hypothetical protein TSOC_010794 [Tetrabaena socialis]
MVPAYAPAQGAGGSLRRCLAGGRRMVRANTATAGPMPGRIVLAAERLQQRPASIQSDPSSAASASATAAIAASPPSGVQVPTPAPSAAAPTQPLNSAPRAEQPAFVPIPEDVLEEFEHKLEADLQTVGVTLTAVMGVIIFWRGVWSLLDHFIGDSVLGDVACVIAGLTIILYIRLTGMKIASFWPPS